MNTYKFYDTDITGHEEYDITDEAYRALIETCFKYSSFVTFRIWNSSAIIPDVWEKYKIQTQECVLKAYPHYYRDFAQAAEEVRCYVLSDEMKSTILEIGSIFKWICGWGYTNPDDPAFFRADGSIFFYSVIHEGECTLMPRDDEDVENIIADKNWRKI